MIGLSDQNSFLLYIGFIGTVYINNQIIIHFINLWSKEVPVNVSYPITVHQIDGYLDARISPSYLRYIITREKQIY